MSPPRSPDSTQLPVFPNSYGIIPTPLPQERTLEDSPVRPEPQSVPQQVETTYHLVLEGTIGGKTKLVTNTGCAFTIRKRRPNGTIDWQCTTRAKDHRCKASVIQRDGAFYAGRHQHNHPG